MMIRTRIARSPPSHTDPSLSLIHIFVEENVEDIEKFQINQGVYNDPINLLSDKMVTKKEFIITEKKTIDSDSMYEAIKNYYECSVKDEK